MTPHPLPRYTGTRAQRQRAALAPLVASGRAVCWRCGEPIEPDDEWDVGHLTDIAEGGHPGGPTRPEHRGRCNRSAGGKLGARRKAQRRARVRDWLAERNSSVVEPLRFFGWRGPKEPLNPPFSLPGSRPFRPDRPGSQLTCEV